MAEVVIHGQDPSFLPGAVNVVTVDPSGNLRVAAGASFPVNNFIWDAESLAWVAATGGLTSGDSVTVLNWPASWTVSGTVSVGNFPASWPVSGTVALSNASPLATYEFSEMDTTSARVNYFGFLDGTGNWYILQLNLPAGQARYAKGPSNYAANWTNRASLAYDYFSNVF